MNDPRLHRHAAPLVVIATLVGLWIAHTLEVEQLTAAGALLPGSVSLSPIGGVHNYMVGVGMGLLLLSVLCGVGLWRTWWRLGHRLDAARHRLHAILRTGRDPEMPGDRDPDPDSLPSAPARLLSLWVPTAIAQILRYVAKENIESATLGGRTSSSLRRVDGRAPC